MHPRASLSLFIRTVLAIGLLLFFDNGHAQLYFNARTLTIANGLSDNRVTCFYKDRKGFMWIGTRNGLNRYDGHSFKVFRPQQGNSISNEVINDIAEDSRGRIWVATMEGLNIFDPASGSWETMVPDPSGSRESLPNFIIWDISIDEQDRIWIASDVFEFCQYDIRSRKFVFYDWPAFARQHPVIKKYGYRSIHRFVVKNEHELWLGTTNGLVKLDIPTRTFTYVGGDYGYDVVDLAYDTTSRKVFVSMERGKFFIYDEQQETFTQVKPVQQAYPSQQFRFPGKNELWMASQEGLIKISDDRTELVLEQNIPQLSGSLLPGGSRSVYIDKNKIRWVASMNGISIYDPSLNVSAFLPLLPVSDKEGANMMGGVFYDDSSASYIVCALVPSAVFIIHAQTGEIKKITTDVAGRPFSYCTAVRQDRNKNIWLLTGTDVYRYDRARKIFELFPMPNKGKEIVFRDMVQDTRGDYWFSSFGMGMFYYNNAEKKFGLIRDSLFNGTGSVTGLAFDDKHNKLLLGTYGESVYEYDILKGKKTAYYETDEIKDYAQLILVNSITQDRKGAAWISTNAGGIYRYNPGSPMEKLFTRYSMRTGLSNNNILSVASDDSTLWLLSGKGISATDLHGKFLFDLDNERTFSFSSYGSDGRYPHDIYFADATGQLLVGVGGGLLIHSPQARDSSFRFPIAITAVNIAGEEVPESSIGDGFRYRLPFRSNAVSFEFAGLYYGTTHDIAYEYKLEGYDKEWIAAGKSYTAAYQNLPPGDYLFHVRAKDKHGGIAGEVAGFSFRIVPPFWRTAFFIALVTILSLAVIGWLINSLLQKLKAERMINSFATSLYGQNTTDDIFWDTAKNCIEKLGFTDCVIYQKDERRNVLVQKAAYGPKNPYRREILNVIEVPVGKGITGMVAKTGKAIIVNDTSKNPSYIVDDEQRLSEIAVPILVDEKVFAVIDSEHRQKNFYTRYHLRILKKIAAICSERISRYITGERLRAKIARDLHDEMGSTLTSINIISKVAMEEKQEQEKLKTYFQKIKDHSARMMESMSDMVWAINPVNDNFEKLILRLKEFAAEMLEPARINYYFTEEGPVGELQFNLEQRKNIYLIVKEAINNIVKYSDATEVNIIFQHKGDKMKMTITDNGVGFDRTMTHSGNGLKNMQSRSEEMGATIHIGSIPCAGTSIVLEMVVT